MEQKIIGRRSPSTYLPIITLLLQYIKSGINIAYSLSAEVSYEKNTCRS